MLNENAFAGLGNNAASLNNSFAVNSSVSSSTTARVLARRPHSFSPKTKTSAAHWLTKKTKPCMLSKVLSNRKLPTLLIARTCRHVRPLNNRTSNKNMFSPHEKYFTSPRFFPFINSACMMQTGFQSTFGTQTNLHSEGMPHRERLKIFSGSAHPELSGEIANYLGRAVQTTTPALKAPYVSQKFNLNERENLKEKFALTTRT